MRHSSSPRSRNDEWPQYPNPAMDQNVSSQPITGHLPNNGLDDPSGINGSPLFMVGAGITDMGFSSSQPQCPQEMSAELDQMESEPSCPVLLARNSLNQQYINATFPFPSDSASGEYSHRDIPMPLLNRQDTNPFEATTSVPLELHPGVDVRKIPEILFPSSEYSYASSYSENSYPGTPNTPSVNSPRSDADPFSQMRDENQSMISYRSSGSGSTYSPSVGGYDDEMSSGILDTEPRPCVHERPNNQFLTPEPLAHTYSYPLGRKGQPIASLFPGKMSRRRPSDIATNYYISPVGFVSDAIHSPLASPTLPDRPRSSSESSLPRPDRQSLKRTRTDEELEGSEDYSAEDSVVRPNIDDAPLKPRRPRGKRHGPLSPTKKEQLNASRAAGNTCLNCCLSKVRCDGNSPCVRCAQGFDTRHMSMCTKAHFKDLIKRRSTVSSTLPSLRDLVKKSVGLTGDLEEIGISHESLIKIRELSGNWDLVISYGYAQLHTIDLTELCRSLSNLQKHRFSPIPFNTVFETHHSRASSSEKTSFRKGALPFKLLAFVKWTNVLKFTTVNQISKDGIHVSKIPSNSQFQIILSQVVLIELRRFERNIYEVLSKTLHNQKGKDPNAVPELVTSLGCLLLSLRWQICLWKRYQSKLDKDAHQEKRKIRFEMIEDICKRLYPYFFLCRERCLEDASSDEPNGADMHYANMSRSTREHFPTDMSEEAFEEWIQDGEMTVNNCQVDEQTLIHTIL